MVVPLVRKKLFNGGKIFSSKKQKEMLYMNYHQKIQNMIQYQISNFSLIQKQIQNQ